MLAKRIELRNFLCFRHLTVELDRGLIGVFGPNGAGKTTLLKAIYALLTGDFGRFVGIKADLVHLDMPPREESFIEGTFEHNGEELTIRRSLSPPGQELQIRGKKIANNNAIQQALLDCIGLTPDVLSSYVFIDQWDMFSFLEKAKADRSKEFQHLCGTHRATILHKLLGDRIQEQTKAIPAEADDTLQLREELKQIEEKIKDRTTRIKELRKVLPTPEAYKKSAKIAKTPEMLADTVRQISQLNSRLDSDEITRKTALALINDARRKQPFKPEDIPAKLEERNAGMKKLQDAAAYSRWLSEVDCADAELAKCEATLAKATKPVKRPKREFVDVSAAVKELTLQKHELEHNQTLVKMFEEKGLANCPVCDTPTNRLLGRIGEAKELLRILPKKISDLEQQVSLLKKDAAAAAEQQKLIAAAEANLAQAKKQRERWNEGPDEVIMSDPEQQALLVLGQQLLEHDQLETELTESRRALDAVMARIATRKEELAPLESRRAKFAKFAKHAPLHQAIVDAAVNVRTELRAAIEVRKSLEATAESLTTRIESRRNAAEKAKQLRAMLSHLDALRTTVHHQQLPKRVAAQRLKQMERGIDQGLQDFGHPFTVIADEDVSLSVQFPHQPPRPAKTLSGGQKVVLAVAFHKALLRTFSGMLGLLCLDEPTAGLDEENLEALHDSLQKFAMETQNAGTQIIVVSHAQRLRSAFNQVVEIPGNA